MFLGMVSLYFFLKHLVTDKKIYLIATALFFALLFYTSYSAIPFIALSQLLWFYQIAEGPNKPRFSSFFILNGITLLLCLPWIILGAAAEDDAWLREIAVVLRIAAREKASRMTDPAELGKIIDQALYKLDVIPAGLVLGQAAYESGYGTSRFAVEGNALFGQWTFGGEGLVPEQQRKQLGDHRIASFAWPFDSVRGYFINLSSHPAYEELRRIRAELKAAGKPVTSMALADGLVNYSERGQEYVDELKGIIRVNGLDIADSAVFRDEPIGFVLGAGTEEKAVEVRAQIEEMRGSGELEKIVARMRLE